MPTAAEVIARLELAPHPEGGWFRETWRDRPEGGRRGAGTAILYLLAAGERSHWHRIDADELWLFHAGAPLRLWIAGPGAPDDERRLGPDVAHGVAPQARVPAGAWQSAEPTGVWSLVSCVVIPAFSFDALELAPPGWTPP